MTLVSVPTRSLSGRFDGYYGSVGVRKLRLTDTYVKSPGVMSLGGQARTPKSFFEDKWTLAQSASGHPPQAPPAEVADDFPCGVMSGSAGDSAARVGTCTAHIQPVQRAAIVS